MALTETSQALLDRLDAAEALLGVTTTTSACGGAADTVMVVAASHNGNDQLPATAGTRAISHIGQQQHGTNADSVIVPVTVSDPMESDETDEPLPNLQDVTMKDPVYTPSSSSTGGLDALAALASKEASQFTLIAAAATSSSSSSSSSSPCLSSDEDDMEAMPPPPPRRRLRSASNPEGMEKWDALSNNRNRQHFVFPSAILEEELAQASAAMRLHQEQRQQFKLQQQQQQQQLLEEDEYEEDDGNDNEHSSSSRQKHAGVACLGTSPDTVMEGIDPEELLRRARSRLLEDLSEGNLHGDKGVLALPHSLAKYKEVYNKNGRIGIYTPDERAAIIARFHDKRSRRVWNKKIRYNCRKSLADRRMRVKGRFVKRSTELQAQAAAGNNNHTTTTTTTNNITITNSASTAPTTVTTDCHSRSDEEDTVMPNVHDPEAGFAPTEDQPYRRLRRHTIT